MRLRLRPANLFAAEYALSAHTARLSRHKPGGIVLLVTMVVLLILAILGYNLASRVAAQRHRDNFLIDYTNACYARDSAIKYALASIQDVNNIKLISRPNEPDFSNLFSLTAPEYRRMLENWAEELLKNQQQQSGDVNNSSGFDMNGPKEPNIDLLDINKIKEYNEFNDINEGNVAGLKAEPNILDTLVIRGPYGPPWPLVAEPVEFKIGETAVIITIEDENAKYPAGWALLDDENVKRESQAGLGTFFEWMGYDSAKIGLLKDQLAQVGSIKPFKVDFKPITQRTPAPAPSTPATRRRPPVRPQRTTYKTTTVPPAEQLAKQAKDFSKLFHSSIIDTEMLAEPTIEGRKESALKYMDLWGATQVNINSAPRQVLEAAFTFGGDAAKIAAEIIKQRKEKPFDNIAELKKQLFGFSSGIEKCEPYITASSSVFTIHVTASSGVAKASAVIVVFKQGDKIERITVVYG
jgi:hypothetical protein